MPAALGPRFVLEAGFLILLAVVVGLADLSPALIILVMAIGWVLVALVEYFSWRQGPGFGAALRSEAVAEAPPAQDIVSEEVVEEAPPSAPTPTPGPAPPEEETAIEPAAASPEEPEQPAAFRPPPETKVRHRLEPLQPRPRRRWLPFGRRDRSQGSVEGSSEEER